MPQMPEWLTSTVRQIIAAIGVILASLNLVEASIFDQIAPALVAIVLIAYDVFRTKDLEEEAAALRAANASMSKIYDDVKATNAKLVAEMSAGAAASKPAAKRATKAKTTEA